MIRLPKLPVRKKLRASTARRSLTSADEMDYEEMSEPNMKLSRALLIVLVLHVVAVAGIIAFNTIKSRQGTLGPSAAAETAPARSTSTPPAGPAAAASVAVANQAPLPASTTDAKPAEQVPIARALPVTSSDSTRTYTVAKGDNPVAIARKLNVSKEELLALNKITDPTKLQIGQTLAVPARTLPKPAAAKPAPKATPKPPPKSTAKPKSTPKPAARTKKSRT
ncbi:hypothetical protein BH20VER1_BH20VER1_22190 [soil metagenome]